MVDATTLPPEELDRLNVKFNQAVDIIRPEAKELVSTLQWDADSQTTKDGYGRVMQFLAGLPGAIQVTFLRAMVDAGYPADTAAQLAEIQGIAQGFRNLNIILDR
jgi:hypothetical protein